LSVNRYTNPRFAEGWFVRLPGLVGWFFLLLLLSAATAIRSRINPVAVSEWDSWGWLDPALSWLGGTGFRERFEREWIYGAFIAACLRLTGSFSGYIIIQQALGVLAAVLMWLTWRRWTALLPKPFILEVVGMITGLLIVAIYLFNPIALVLELSIRPEAIMAFTAFLQLFCIASYCRFRWQEPRAAASLIYGAFAMLLAYALFILKPNWLLAVPATTLPVFIGLFGKAIPISVRLTTPLLGLFLIVFALILPDKLLFTRTAETRVVLPMTLFTIHADVIQESMKHELETPGATEERRRFLEVFLPLLDREMETAKTLASYYPRLGFDPDYLMYRSTVFPFLEQDRGMSRAEIASFCRSNFISGITRQPLLYARKVFTQLGYFFFPDDATFFRSRIKMGKLYEYVLTTVPESLDTALSQPVRELFDAYRRSAVLQAARSTNLEVFGPSRGFLRVVSATAFWIEIAFFLTVASCLLVSSLARFRLAAFVAAIFFFAPAGNALTIALIHALDNSRYRGSYGPLLLFALAAMFVFIVTTITYVVMLILSEKNRDQYLSAG
jgi:hypothetical protein